MYFYSGISLKLGLQDTNYSRGLCEFLCSLKPAAKEQFEQENQLYTAYLAEKGTLYVHYNLLIAQ